MRKTTRQFILAVFWLVTFSTAISLAGDNDISEMDELIGSFSQTTKSTGLSSAQESILDGFDEVEEIVDARNKREQEFEEKKRREVALQRKKAVEERKHKELEAEERRLAQMRAEEEAEAERRVRRRARRRAEEEDDSSNSVWSEIDRKTKRLNRQIGNYRPSTPYTSTPRSSYTSSSSGNSKSSYSSSKSSSSGSGNNLSLSYTKDENSKDIPASGSAYIKDKDCGEGNYWDYSNQMCVCKDYACRSDEEVESQREKFQKIGDNIKSWNFDNIRSNSPSSSGGGKGMAD